MAAPAKSHQRQLDGWQAQRADITKQANLNRAGWLGDTAALREAIEQGADLTAADANGTTPMGFACGYGKLAAVSILLSAKADVNAMCAKNGERALHRAARFGHFECTSLLIEAGANVALQDSKGWTALQHAAGRGHAMVLALLCSTAQDSAMLSVALRTAAQYGRCPCVRVLLSYGAEVDSCDSESGHSALGIAAAWGHPSIVAVLLHAQANIELRSADNMCAMDAAADRGYTRCVDLLQAQDMRSESACVRVCVIKARQLSPKLAVLEAQHAEDSNVQLSLIFDSSVTVDRRSNRSVDMTQLMSGCRLTKEERVSKGTYIDANILTNSSGVHVTELINQSVETHAHWQARVSRHGADGSRFAVFAQFVVDTLQLHEGSTVLEVAGGRGGTACELIKLGVHRVILVDPAPHAGAAAADQIALGQISVIRESLDDAFIAKYQELIDGCDAVVALHPDEATDAAVHLGLRLHLPLAVVPCCVFPKLFLRKRRAGQGVVSCNGLADYLVELEPSVMRSQLLPFEGANRVVYSVPRCGHVA